LVRHRSKALTLLLASAVAAGVFVGISSMAQGHASCDLSQGDPDIHNGDEHQNTCWGGNDFDSFYGQGDHDTLGGEGGRDKIRGSTGDDTLSDSQGNGDIDRICEGSGFDIIKLRDGDPDDTWYDYYDGSFQEDQEYAWDELNDHDTISSGNPSCPMSDP
jgi:Ca2+-binding RTX toxin-like protein